MSRFRVLSGTAAVLVGSALVYSYAWRAPQAPEAAGPQRLKPAMRAPVDAPQGKKAGKINGEGAIRYTAEGPSAIELRDVPRAAAGAAADLPRARRRADRVALQRRAGGGRGGRREGAEEERFRAELRRLAETGRPQDQVSSEFDAIDAATAARARASPRPCLRPRPRGRTEPRDRGRQHGLRGVRQAGPVSHGSDPVRHLLDPTQGGSNTNPGAPTPGCSAFTLQFGAQRGAVFDPDVVYDEAEDRFVICIDGNGDSFCVAASQTGDPTAAWYCYGFPTDVTALSSTSRTWGWAPTRSSWSPTSSEGRCPTASRVACSRWTRATCTTGRRSRW